MPNNPNFTFESDLMMVGLSKSDIDLLINDSKYDQTNKSSPMFWEEVNENYQKLLNTTRKSRARELHPDANPNAGDQLAQVNAAIDRLSSLSLNNSVQRRGSFPVMADPRSMGVAQIFAMFSMFGGNQSAFDSFFSSSTSTSIDGTQVRYHHVSFNIPQTKKTG